MNTYLLIANTVESLAGGRIPADVIAGRRLAAAQWPLFRNTPHQKEMRPGDEAIIYLAGAKHMQFVASATIDGLVSARSYGADGDDALTDAPVQAILLSGVRWFDSPVGIRAIMGTLGFVPKHTNKWGCVLQRGAKKISTSDARLIKVAGSRDRSQVA